MSLFLDANAVTDAIVLTAETTTGTQWFEVFGIESKTEAASIDEVGQSLFSPMVGYTARSPTCSASAASGSTNSP